MKKKPNLFICGPPRSATSSLNYWLSCHPGIFAHIGDEPMYFASDILRKRIETEEEYHKLFKKAKSEKWVLEKSSFYIYSREAPHRIYKYNPNARLIFILRNPADFIMSWRATQGLEPPTPDNLTDEEKDWCDYAKHLKQWMEVFPREQIKVIVFDDLVNDPQAVYWDLCRWLDIKFFTPKFVKLNAGTIDDKKLITKVGRKMTWAKKLVPTKMRVKLKDKMRRSNNG